MSKPTQTPNDIFTKERLRFGWNIPKMSERTGVHQNTIREYEEGLKPVSPLVVYRCLPFFRIPREVMALLKLDTLGGQIRYARLQKGFTQKYLAKQLGINPYVIGYIENHSLAPTGLLQQRLERELGIRLPDVSPELPIPEKQLPVGQ